jgi:hypothetical protein
MQNKPNPKNWTDVQLVIAAIAFTLALGFWNFFSALAKKDIAAQVAQATLPPSPAPASVVVLTPTPLPKIKILLGGVAPQINQASAAQPSAAQPAKKRKPGGGGGGGGGPVTSTKSS